MSRNPGSSLTLLAAVAVGAAILLSPTRPAASGPTAPFKEPWKVLKAIRHQGLQIFPIVLIQGKGSGNPKEYITLDEGLKSGVIVVTEVGQPTPLVRGRPSRGGGSQGQTFQNQQARGGQGQGAEVNRLLITNSSGRKLVLLAGEMVVGGQQDRIVQKDMIIAPTGKPFDLSVFCVEHGRWTPNSASFAPASNAIAKGGAVADPTVRGAAQGSRRQEDVWQKVAEKNSQAGGGGFGGGSGTYGVTVSSDKAQKDAKPYMDAISKGMPDGAVGAIIAIHGEIVWVDAFRTPDLFQRYWPKLLQSYIVDAMTTPVPPANERMPRVLREPPTIADAEKFLFDRTGKSAFEGTDGVYLLRRIEAPTFLIFELEDLLEGLHTQHGTRVHFNKMKKR